MLPESFEKSKEEFFLNLSENIKNRDKIQKATILQRDSGEWLQLRRNMLTASLFGTVIKRREDISCGPLVKNLLSPKCLLNVPSIRHGIVNERVALSQLSVQENVVINPCGLYIDLEYPFFGASPDGITEDMVVEVKCPITAFKMGLDETVLKRKVTFWKLVKGQLVINKQHSWYYQIQGQLHITGKERCLFGLWTGKENTMKVEYIRKDDAFWKQFMESKLIRFYMECLLPELLDSRLMRNMAIKEPQYIVETMQSSRLRKSKIHTKTRKLLTSITKPTQSQPNDSDMLYVNAEHFIYQNEAEAEQAIPINPCYNDRGAIDLIVDFHDY